MVVSFCARRALLTKHSFLKVPKRNGYIILSIRDDFVRFMYSVPEIGEDLPHKNPLLKEDRTPEFNIITIEKCIAAIGRQTVEFEERIKFVGDLLERNKNADIFEDALLPLEELYVPLETTWGIAKVLYFGHQNAMPTKHYLNIHGRARVAANNRYINLPIYKTCTEVLSKKSNTLTDEQKRILHKYILEGRLNALDLPQRSQDNFKYMTGVLIRKMEEFKEKLEVATKKFSYTIRDATVIQDFPENYLRTIAADPTQPKQGPWTVNLSPAIKDPFMEYCPSRVMRYKVWEADVTKASLLQDKMLQNSSALEEIRDKKSAQAKLLGYKSYAEMSMETKMAGSLENVYATFDMLLERARPAQAQELTELQAFAHERGLQGEIQLWDIPYWSRKQRNSLYKYNKKDVQNYFPFPKVLLGVFELIETLFNVKIIEGKKPDVWHKDVRFFYIFDMNQSTTKPVAHFYLDPYAREDEKVRLEQDSGWIITMRNRSQICDTTPLAALIFNFQPPDGDKPSLLSFEEVQILFKKFGHLLQHSLTTVNSVELSGTSFVEWDAIYISDNFFANWLHEPWVLQQISGHYDTKQPLTPEIIETLRNVRLHLAGYNLSRELYLSSLDLELYSSNQFWYAIVKRLWPKFFVFPLHEQNSHVCSFERIFTEGWGAAYYSSMWSEMIAADLFSAFQEIGANEKQRQIELATRYRDTFLALGGSYPAREIFRKFRGRDPSPKALLRSLGLYDKSTIINEGKEEA